MAEATSSRLVIRSTSGVSMHSEATRHGVGGPGCARPLARPRAARHHIRRDARVWAQPKWNHALVAQQAEQPPCKRQAARSNRRRGHQTCRVRLDGRGHRAFNPGTRVRSPHATPEQRSPRRAHASKVEIGRNDWAAPEPVTGWIQWGRSSTPGRAAALQAAGCRFEPCHLHQRNNASLTQWPECRPV